METLKIISCANEPSKSNLLYLNRLSNDTPETLEHYRLTHFKLRKESRRNGKRTIDILRDQLMRDGVFGYTTLELDMYAIGMLKTLSLYRKYLDDGIIPKGYRRFFHYSERNHRDCYNMHMMSAYIMCTSYGGDLRLRNLVQHKRKE